jgi:hypothetical protein
MWSDRYRYYNIQSDLQLTKKAETSLVVDILLNTNLFVQKDHQSFANAENFPWVDILIADSNDGNFSATDKPFPRTSLISIVTARGDEVEESTYTNVFLDIADKLNWKLFLEADDKGGEYIEVQRS